MEVVRQALEATGGGDPDGGQAFFDPSIEWDMSGVPEWPERSVYRGGEVGEFLRSWAGSWQGWHFDVTEVRDAGGDLAFAGIHERAIGTESEVSVDQYRYFIATVRSGRITRVQTFSDRSEALQAAGLSE